MEEEEGFNLPSEQKRCGRSGGLGIKGERDENEPKRKRANGLGWEKEIGKAAKKDAGVGRG